MSSNPENAQVTIGGHFVGQGTSIFRYALESEFRDQGADVTIHNLRDGSPIAMTTWMAIREGYRVAPHNGLVRSALYSDGQRRAGALTTSANRGFFSGFTGDEKIVAVHGMYGIGRDRYLAGGDVYPETFVDGRTTSYVTLPQTRDLLNEKSSEKPKAIEVVGFMVPSQLRSEKRRADRQEKFALGEPTDDNPLRIAFMTTGQFNNMDYLHDTLMKDPLITRWIKEGRAQLDIYLWNSLTHALDTYSRAKIAGLKPVMREKYHPKFDEGHGVQIFSNPFRVKAIEGAVQMGYANDILFSIAAEKMPWFSELPGIGLPIVAQNNKMAMNTQWAQEMGLIGPDSELASPGEVILDQLRSPQSRFRTQYERVADGNTKVAQEVGNQNFELFSAARQIPQRVLGATR